MNFLASRQFWTGVAVTTLVGVLVVTGVPNMYRAKRIAAPVHERMEDVTRSTGLSGGGGGGSDRAQLMGFVGKLESAGYDDERKMIRNASIGLIVKHPKETSDSIRQIAEEAGGYLVSSETYGGDNASSASLTIRVPSTSSKMCEQRSSSSACALRVKRSKPRM